MKRRLSFVLAAALAGLLTSAPNAKSADGAAASLSPDDRAQYTGLTRTELELNTKFKLLTELADLHTQRAAESSKAGTPERTKWEADLAQELNDGKAVVLGQLNDTTKRRLAFEAAHASLPAAGAGSGALAEGKGLNANELLFVTRIDERLAKVREGLAASMAADKGLYAQLQTNNTAEAVGRVSALLEENSKQTRQWEREASDLELKKLEFQALRK